ncbi:MAG: hypothetical protein GY797_27320 [Deltaproteobacteria bacterium]|nr:hypothetical protein [Deltaproteobacteria bacterium]
MGEFSDLNPDASWKEDYWSGIKDDMEKILNELNSDVFSKEGWRIEVNHHGVAPLLKPNLALTDGLNYIGIGVSHDKDKIRVLACTGFKWVWEDKYYTENTILKYRDTVLIVKRLTKWLLDHRRA